MFLLIICLIILICYFIYSVILKVKLNQLLKDIFNNERDIKLDINNMDKQYVVFDDHVFPAKYLLKYYKSYENNINLKEVLPSIYCIKENKNLYLINKNIRNTFYIFKPTGKIMIKMEEKYDIEIDPNKLPYPESLGGGCPIWYDFFRTKLYKGFNSFEKSLYSILTEKDILEVTAYDDRFKHRYCENKEERCYEPFLKNILDKTFTFNKDSKIEITKYNNCYRVEEGKHRVCAFKRYNWDKIKVDQVELNYDYLPSYRNCNNYPIPDNILNDYYKSYNDIGIDNTTAKYITENIDNSKFISFLETYYKKDIFTILKEL